MAAVLTIKPLRFVAALTLRLYQRLGLQHLVRSLHLLGHGPLARLESLLPPIHLPRLPVAQGSGTGPRVALFAGCTSPLVEPETLAAAVNVLERLGCRVEVPRAQGCCGALHSHDGMHEPAARCAENNIDAFAQADAVVGVASGCAAQLVEYDRVAPSAGAAAFARKVQDVHAYIASHPALGSLRFRPLEARVLLHTPCTLRNVLKGETAVRALLERIPGLQIETMDAGCCGAAGAYFVTQPEMADALLEKKLEQVRSATPSLVLSSNVGCAMHFAAGLRRAGGRSASVIPVRHPLQLVAQQLADS
jgi:glycolate oxidase iron-sulfur subunit